MGWFCNNPVTGRQVLCYWELNRTWDGFQWSCYWEATEGPGMVCNGLVNGDWNKGWMAMVLFWGI
jgi:hypothetical protein